MSTRRVGRIRVSSRNSVSNKNNCNYKNNLPLPAVFVLSEKKLLRSDIKKNIEIMIPKNAKKVEHTVSTLKVRNVYNKSKPNINRVDKNINNYNNKTSKLKRKRSKNKIAECDNSNTVRRTMLRKNKLSNRKDAENDGKSSLNGSGRVNVRTKKGKHCSMTSQQFQKYIDEMYLRNLNSIDLSNLVNVGNRIVHISNEKTDFVLPSLGRHYEETWKKEDEKFIKKYGLAALNGVTGATTSPSHNNDSLIVNANAGVPNNVVNDEDHNDDSTAVPDAFKRTCIEIKKLEAQNKKIIDEIVDISVVHQLSNKIRQSAENILIKLANNVLQKKKSKDTMEKNDNKKRKITEKKKFITSKGSKKHSGSGNTFGKWMEMGS